MVGNFTNLTFSGYKASGQINLDQVCFNEQCFSSMVYIVQEIHESKINKNLGEAMGILGTGPLSTIMNNYRDVSTGQSIYSVQLSGL